MKVLMINGSPRKNGNTATALHEMEKIFLSEGIDVELIHVGHLPVRSCIACGKCREMGKCVFDDIVNLDDMTIQRVLRDVDQPTLALSLKGASDSLMEAIKRNISSRAAERLLEEIEYLGPVRLADVEKAQITIVETIRRLEDSGEIVLSSGGDDDVVY